MPTVTASAASQLQLPSGELMTVNDFQNLVLVKGTDEVFKRGFDTSLYPFQGSMFYDSKPLSTATYTTQTTVGMGNVPRNTDEEDLPSDTQGMGFTHSMTSYMYRMKYTITRELIEDNMYPNVIGDNAEDLMLGARRTVEEVMADGVNRALGASGAPFLCEDGMYWIDSDRNNPTAVGGTWSNLETTAALTASALFTAQLAFRQHRNARGVKEPLRMTTIFIRPDEEQTITEILNSPLRPTDAMNAVNWAHNRFGYMVYDHMTTQQVLYKAEGKRNEVYQLWRSQPNVMPVTVTDPDRISARVRFRFGLGALRPDLWRGGQLT